MMLSGNAVVLTENNLNIPVGTVVRLTQVDLMYKIDISETNAGPKWVPNPHSQFILNGGDFEDKPFLMYVHDYQILSQVDGYEGADLENTIKNFTGK